MWRDDLCDDTENRRETLMYNLFNLLVSVQNYFAFNDIRFGHKNANSARFGMEMKKKTHVTCGWLMKVHFLNSNHFLTQIDDNIHAWKSTKNTVEPE